MERPWYVGNHQGFDWRKNALQCLAALAVGQESLQIIPASMTFPADFSSICNILWQNCSSGGSDEACAVLVTSNGSDVVVKAVASQHVAELPKHPNHEQALLAVYCRQSLPLSGVAHLCNGAAGGYHPWARLVLLEQSTSLILPDVSVQPARHWIYRSRDRQNFYRYCRE